MRADSIKHIYFVGIGGIGMSALARFFKHAGAHVSGYDRTATPLTEALINEGIPVHYDDEPSLIPQQLDLAVYTPAVPAGLNEMKAIRERNIPLKKEPKCWNPSPKTTKPSLLQAPTEKRPSPQ